MGALFACGSSSDLQVDDGGTGSADGNADDGSAALHDAGNADATDDARQRTDDAAASHTQPPQNVYFRAEAPALPDFGWDSGLQPPASPVQLQLSVSSRGVAVVNAVATSSGSASAPVLAAVQSGGNVAIDGALVLEGRLVIGITGLPKYDGPIPGLSNIEFKFSDTQVFDPFLIGQTVTAAARIPAVTLPPIPLPGGIDGDLILEAAEGSTVDLTFEGTCAAIEGDQAEYLGTLARGGNLVLRARIEVEVPGLGTRSFAIPDISIPINLPARDADLGTRTVLFGPTPVDPGEIAMVGSCSD